MKVQCSYCSLDYEIESGDLGKSVTCPACGKSFILARPNADEQGLAGNGQAQKYQQPSQQAPFQAGDAFKPKLQVSVSQVVAKNEDMRKQYSDDSDLPITSGDGCMALFDFKFCKFISPSLIRFIYIISFWLSLLGSIVWCVIDVIGISRGMVFFLRIKDPALIAVLILFRIVVTPIVWLISLAIIRTAGELLMAIFNMERLARYIEKNTRQI